MGLFKKKNGGFVDVIRCDEPSYLIWKWHPSGVLQGENNRENSIRYGSSLRVKDGEVAVFVYKQKDGTMQDYILGPYDEKIKTKNFPILSNIVGLAFEGGTPFQAEIYFINLAKIVQVRFAVPYFNVFDVEFPEFGVPVSVSGTITFQIGDYKEFIKKHRLINFDLSEFYSQIRDAVVKIAKNTVANIPTEKNLPIIQIERRIEEISDVVDKNLKGRLEEEFGVILTSVDISNIEIDKTSTEYTELMAITKDMTTAKIKSRTFADLEHYEETLRIQREEGQYAQHKGVQSANIAAYQIEKQAEVGVAGAEALGQMGANNAGGVDLGGSGAGFNPVNMMAGMAIGGAVGQNIAGIMNGVMAKADVTQNPPTISDVGYFIAVNNQSTGPYDMAVLKQMISAGIVTCESLVWKQGLPKWIPAKDMQELNLFFEKNIKKQAPPPIEMNCQTKCNT